MLSNKSKSKRRYSKELKSFRNKMGDNLFWFDSLTSENQYDLLFQWKYAKNRCNIKTPTVKNILTYDRNGQRIKKEIKIYPIKLKYWITEIIILGRFIPSLRKKREVAIKMILD
jgi:hypothetical protein